MNYLTTDLIEALAKKQDIEEVFRRHIAIWKRLLINY